MNSKSHTFFVLYYDPNPSLSSTTPEERDDTKIEAIFSTDDDDQGPMYVVPSLPYSPPFHSDRRTIP